MACHEDLAKLIFMYKMLFQFFDDLLLCFHLKKKLLLWVVLLLEAFKTLWKTSLNNKLFNEKNYVHKKLRCSEASWEVRRIWKSPHPLQSALSRIP